MISIPIWVILKYNNILINSMQKIDDMGEKSSVTINTRGKGSVKTTIPISLARQFDIKQGDQLDWSLGKFGDDELVMVVRKEGKKLEQNIIPFEFIESERRKTIKKLKDLLSEEEMEEIRK